MGIEFFADNIAVAQMEADLPTQREGARINLLLALAWQLRQRDSNRALRLAEEVQNLLTDTNNTTDASLSKNEREVIALRLVLIRAEVTWLFGKIEAGKTLAENALQGFSAINDALGCADTYWLLASIALSKGDVASEEGALKAMAARLVNQDPVRVLIAEVAMARFAALRDVSAAKAHWGPRVLSISLGNDASAEQPRQALHPAVACLIEDFWGITASLSSDYVEAVQRWSNTYTLALATGQLRRAMIAAAGIGDSFKNLNEYNLPLEWMQRGLDLARNSGWPIMIGIALMQTGETMRHLERFDAAHDMLREALSLLEVVTFSRTYAICLHYLGEVELDRKQYASALNTFQLLEQRALSLGQTDLRSRAQTGQARALLQLEQPQPAMQAANLALASGKSNARYQIAALRVMADIHIQHPLATPSGMNAASIPLHYLQQALDLAATIEAYTIPSDLLDALAKEFARIGDWQQAFQKASEASIAREKIHNKEARNRADAMQVNRQAEQARSEAEHLRQLASAEARRAEALQKNAETLEHLGAIGREITACLDAGLVFQVLKRHVHHLLDVNAFIILLLTDDGTALNLAFGIEDGKPQPPVRIALSCADSDAARSVRERREIMIDHDPGQESNASIPGTKPTLSRMFAPLWLADKVIGVMTIQSVNSHAYGSREQFIFRTLCAYTAIALGNADTLQALHQAQAQLVQQEKMASLGGLVANFAHEINTPIAAVKSSNKIVSDSVRDTLSSLPQLFQILNLAEQALFMQLVCPNHKSKAVLTTRQERSMARAIKHILEAESISNAHQKASILVQLRRSEMIQPFLPLLKHAQCDAILTVARQFSMIDDSTLNIDTATNRVASIIAALNAFSDVGLPYEKVATHLQEGIEATLVAYQNQMQNKVLVARDYASIPALHCVPHELNQVWDNLIRNALHAMAYDGTLSIRLRHEDGNAVVEVQDTGTGIPEAIRGRIFDAFFSTKTTGEGSGLGLAIVKKIIERHQGRIEFDTVADGGTKFKVYLPYA